MLAADVEDPGLIHIARLHTAADPGVGRRCSIQNLIKLWSH